MLLTIALKMYRGGVGPVKLAGATSCCKPPGAKIYFTMKSILTGSLE